MSIHKDEDKMQVDSKEMPVLNGNNSTVLTSSEDKNKSAPQQNEETKDSAQKEEQKTTRDLFDSDSDSGDSGNKLLMLRRFGEFI